MNKKVVLLMGFLGLYLMLSILVPLAFKTSLANTIFPLYQMAFKYSHIFTNMTSDMQNDVAYVAQFFILAFGFGIICWTPNYFKMGSKKRHGKVPTVRIVAIAILTVLIVAGSFYFMGLIGATNTTTHTSTSTYSSTTFSTPTSTTTTTPTTTTTTSTTAGLYVFYNSLDQQSAQVLATKVKGTAIQAPSGEPSNLIGMFLVGGADATGAPSWWHSVYPPYSTTSLSGVAGNTLGYNYYVGTYLGVNLVFGLTSADTLALCQSYPNAPSTTTTVITTTSGTKTITQTVITTTGANQPIEIQTVLAGTSNNVKGQIFIDGQLIGTGDVSTNMLTLNTYYTITFGNVAGYYAPNSMRFEYTGQYALYQGEYYMVARATITDIINQNLPIIVITVFIALFAVSLFFSRKRKHKGILRQRTLLVMSISMPWILLLICWYFFPISTLYYFVFLEVIYTMLLAYYMHKHGILRG